MDHHIRRSGWALLLWWALGAPVALACSGSPFADAWNWGGSSTWEEDDGKCDFRAQVWTGSTSSMASTSYMRRDPTAPLRLRFTLDAPGIPALNAVQAASLARGVVRRVEASSLPAAPVFNLLLTGNLSASKYYLSLQGWCASASAHSCSSNVPAFDVAEFPLQITLDAEVGAGAAGRLRLWVNADPDTAAPSLELSNLDNTATGGIDRVAIGLFSTSPAFNQAVGGQPMVFRDVETSDDQLFWSDFESLLPGNIDANRPALLPHLSYGGTTCGGSELLPQVAHGTASLYGPVAIHPVSLDGTNLRFSLDSEGTSPLLMFLCPAGSGPSGACLAAGRSGGYDLLVTGDAPMGEYQLVIGGGTFGAGCTGYNVRMTGPLDQ